MFLGFYFCCVFIELEWFILFFIFFDFINVYSKVLEVVILLLCM